MKYTIILFFFLGIQLTLQAQISKGQKLVEKGDFEGAITAFENDLEKITSRPVSLQELSKIHSNKKYSGYDISKAYQYIVRAQEEYEKLNSTNKKKLQSQGISQIGMSKYQNDLVIIIIQVIEQEKDLEAAENFLKNFKSASARQIENMSKFRDNLAFEKACSQNSFAAFEYFYKTYELSCSKYNKDLLIKSEKKLLESYIAEKGWQHYPSFEEKYPNNIYVKDSKAAYALIKIVRKNSLEEFQKFTIAYPHSLFNRFAQDGMYEVIMAGTNLPQYDEFVRAYPDYENNEKIWLRFYNLYLQEHGVESVGEFAKSYPNYPFQDAINNAAKDAQYKKDLPFFEQAKKTEDILFILNFIDENPSSPFVVQLEETMYKALKKRPLFRGCRNFLRLFPKSNFYDQVLDILYDIYVSDGEWVTINQFMMEYPEYKNIDKQQKDLKLAELGSKIKLEDNFHADHSQEYSDYISAAAPKERAFVALQRLMEYYIHEKKWDEALSQLNKLAPAFGEKNPKIENLKALLSAQTVEVKKMSLGAGINSDFHEYIPLISVDNKLMYFCRLDKAATGKEDENIYVSHLKDNQWQPAEYLQGLNTHHNNEGPLAISADNRHLIIFNGNLQNGDMQVSEHSSNGWSKAVSLPSTINTSSWDADALISSDGKALLFVSEREEVLDLRLGEYPASFHGRKIIIGNRDIFVSIKSESGEWQAPINLGDVINTPYVERTPFLHPDMKTLYFSSEGHGGLGRLDVFKTTRLDDSWTNWSTPVNLGKSINTIQNDWGYRISTDGKTAYFSATNDKGNEDIYSIELPKEFRPDVVSTISGHLTDYSGNPIEAEIVWEDIETGNEVGRLTSNHTTGAFYIVLPNNKQYSYFVFKEGYFPKSNNIDLRNVQGVTEINEKMALIKIDEMVEHSISLPLKNLFFETNKFNLKSSSYLELNRLMELVKKYDLTINISGHTDNTGNSKENLLLSQQRADEVKKYLVSKGCKESKIESIGYGQNKPVADNKTEDGKRHNRRVEVRFQK